MNAKAMTTTKRLFSGKTAPLHTLCKAITDCHHSTPSWTDSGYVVVRSENVKRGLISLEGASYTDQSTFFERISRSVPEPGDLIITREAPMGEVGMIPEGVQCCLGQRLVLVKPDALKIDRHYLLYAMQSPFVQKQIGASDETGSTVSNLRIPALKELAIPLLSGAKDIGAVLAALDTKIDLNHRINAELEVLAKTIYDYWFVQFDFPDVHGRPYKSSGGAMVWNDTLKREIPAGWEAGVLSDIAKITMGQSPAGDSYNEDGRGEVFFQGSTDFGARSPDVRMYTTAPGRMAREGDILMSVRAPVGTLNIADRPCCIGRGLAALRGKDGSGGYLYRVLMDLKQVFDRRSSEGTTFGSINKNDLFGLRVLIPKPEVRRAYEEMAHNWFQLDALRDKESRELTQLRDWLLPLLMNGQVRVA